MAGSKKTVTITDVARAAGVSKMTVSRVINGYEHVSPAVRHKVEDAMDALNFVPNQLARSLMSRRSNFVGLIVSNMMSPFFTGLAHGAECASYESGYRLILGIHEDDLTKEADYIDTMIAARADGLIITPVSNESQVSLKRLRQHGVPFVLVDRLIDGVDSDAVISDNVTGAYEVTRRLILQGHRRIAIITGPMSIYTARERLAGYRRALADAGLARSPRLECSVPFLQYNVQGETYVAVRQAITDFLAEGDPITALFAVNHATAVQSLRVMGELGLSEQVALATFEDVDPFRIHNVSPLSAVQPAQDMGREAFALLMNRIHKDERPRVSLMLHSEIRESSTQTLTSP